MNSDTQAITAASATCSGVRRTPNAKTLSPHDRAEDELARIAERVGGDAWYVLEKEVPHGWEMIGVVTREPTWEEKREDTSCAEVLLFFMVARGNSREHALKRLIVKLAWACV